MVEKLLLSIPFGISSLVVVTSKFTFCHADVINAPSLAKIQGYDRADPETSNPETPAEDILSNEEEVI